MQLLGGYKGIKLRAWIKHWDGSAKLRGQGVSTTNKPPTGYLGMQDACRNHIAGCEGCHCINGVAMPIILTLTYTRTSCSWKLTKRTFSYTSIQFTSTVSLSFCCTSGLFWKRKPTSLATPSTSLDIISSWRWRSFGMLKNSSCSYCIRRWVICFSQPSSKALTCCTCRTVRVTHNRICHETCSNTLSTEIALPSGLLPLYLLNKEGYGYGSKLVSNSLDGQDLSALCTG